MAEAGVDAPPPEAPVGTHTARRATHRPNTTDTGKTSARLVASSKNTSLSSSPGSLAARRAVSRSASDPRCPGPPKTARMRWASSFVGSMRSAEAAVSRASRVRPTFHRHVALARCRSTSSGCVSSARSRGGEGVRGAAEGVQDARVGVHREGDLGRERVEPVWRREAHPPRDRSPCGRGPADATPTRRQGTTTPRLGPARSARSSAPVRPGPPRRSAGRRRCRVRERAPLPHRAAPARAVRGRAVSRRCGVPGPSSLTAGARS